MDLGNPVKVDEEVKRRIRRKLEVWEREFKEKLEQYRRDGTLDAEAQL